MRLVWFWLASQVHCASCVAVARRKWLCLAASSPFIARRPQPAFADDPVAVQCG